jgi:hypothetical protein
MQTILKHVSALTHTNTITRLYTYKLPGDGVETWSFYIHAKCSVDRSDRSETLIATLYFFT